jgi:hypothetical protein
MFAVPTYIGIEHRTDIWPAGAVRCWGQPGLLMTQSGCSSRALVAVFDTYDVERAICCNSYWSITHRG